ncbi:MAG: hypothetical protein JW776_05740 [Candidatus Lokiarchaeota archaeon]|nr:hypothetical protein [Candidatus Lokiarchaeota archaeon]
MLYFKNIPEHAREEKESEILKTIIIIMKALLAATLVWMLFVFTPIMDTSIVDLTSITTLLLTLRNIFLVGIYYFLLYLFEFIGILTSISFIPLPSNPYFNQNFQTVFYTSTFRDILFTNWFPQVQLSERAVELIGDPLLSGMRFSIDDYIQYVVPELRALGNSFYIILFQVLAVLMIIYGILSVVRTDPRYSLRTILFLNLMIIFPLMLYGIENLVAVFVENFNFGQYIGINDVVEGVAVGEFLPYPIQPEIVFMEIPENFGAFLISPIFQIALASFLYLEFTFQLNYVDQVTSPSEQRAERLYEQVQTLKRASREAVINLEKIEAGEPIEIIEQELDEEGNVIEKIKVESVRKFLSKTATGFSFIREMIERRKLEEKTKRAVEALQDTRRLSNYLNRLFEQDPEAEQTLTAKSSAPRAGRLIRSTVIDMVFRIVGITFLVFIISLTPWVIEHIFRAPESIVNSVEMFTPEVILTLFIPLVLMFPFISIIIRQTKAQQLRKKLKQEEETRTVTETKEFIAA